MNAYPDDPMIFVSWYGAVGYCQWLNEVEFGGNTNLWKYRLPTEWEYEFQMGAKQVSETRGSIQDWGSTSWTYGQAHDTIRTTANASDWVNYGQNIGNVVTVGGKGGDGRNATNIFGAYDMSGQVFKWCLDKWNSSPGVSGKNYVNKSGSSRSRRGGDWYYEASYSAASYRGKSAPGNRFSDFGFRVVRDLIVVDKDITPFVDITNESPMQVVYTSSSANISGTNLNIAGQLAWMNDRHPETTNLFALGFSTTINQLAEGNNLIQVFGTNQYGHWTNATVTIHRETFDEVKPFIDITNTPPVVAYNQPSADISGTNVNIAGQLSWFNDQVPATTTTFASGFSTTVNNLDYGDNVITVSGTNIYGLSTNTTVTITRETLEEVLPFVKITNLNATVTYNVTSYTIAGSNNANIVGGISWTNSLSGDGGTGLVSGLGFRVSDFTLDVGDNLITVSGSNLFGFSTNDSVTITRTGKYLGDGGTTPVHYVSLNGGNVWPYTNWVEAATNIQDAVDTATTNDLVLVSNGTYMVSSEISVDISLNISSVNGPETTIIRSDGSSRCMNLGSYATVISGFTLTNGNAGSGYGGGVYCGDTTPIITNCTISGNNAGDYGGGTSYGTINNCTISGNSSGNRGGGTSYGEINNCTISGNSADYGGGGTFDGEINNCTISGNSADYGGGTYESTINNSSIRENSVVYHGGGSSRGTINNCTISGNSAGLYGGGTYSSTIRNSIVYYNTARSGNNIYVGTVSFCCTTPDPGGAGNITDAPGLFSYYDPHIFTNSPCVNAGTNNVGGVVLDGDFDIDGDPRIVGGTVDIGCDEVTNLTGTLTAGIITESTNIVVNESLALFANIQGKVTYTVWQIETSGNSRFVTNAPEVSQSWSQTGAYEVVLWAYNTENSASATITVEVVSFESALKYVSLDGNHIYPFTNWIDAATNIQDAVEAQNIYRGTVLVTNGVYSLGERVTPGYALSNRVMITKNIIVRSVNDPQFTTILGNGTPGNRAVRCVYMSAGELHGFTLSNGYTMTSGDNYFEESGGGAYAYGGIISNCVIRGNSANQRGGGTAYGTIYNCTFSGNTAGYYGGGTAYGTIYNCTISGNTANNSGGGTFDGTIYNCTISGNTTGNRGGGTYQGTINNCTISGNSAANDGGGTYYGSIYNSIVYYNSAATYTNRFDGTYLYSCTTVDGTNGTGNITGPPQFIDTNSANYNLSSSSPCINAGLNAYVQGSTDLEGNDRIIGGTVDMGAYEATYGTGSPFIDITTTPQTVSYDVTSVQVAGTNNFDVAGIMWASNSANGMVEMFSASLSWTTPELFIEFGTNSICVFGTNLFGYFTNDCIDIIRPLPGPTDPYIDITTTPTEVTYNISTYTVAGTNNANVVGVLTWTNSLTGGSGSFLPSLLTFNFSLLTLGYGDNLITVSGTNISGESTFDVVSIYRQTLAEVLPFIAITNAPANISYVETTADISGTNLFIAGDLGWYDDNENTNWFTQSSNAWSITITGLEEGANVITVIGTNIYGHATNDSVTITRQTTAQVAPFIKITNAPANISYGETSADIAGTNLLTAGNLGWIDDSETTNWFARSGNAWSETITGLEEGANIITVLGTNIYGHATNDSVTITRSKFLDDGGATPIHYASLTGGNVWPYTNWATAAVIIQDAVDTAMSGDAVLVTNGIYSVGGAMSPGHALYSRVVIAKSVTVHSVNGPDATQILGKGPVGASAVRCAYLTNGAQLIGFTLSNGFTAATGGSVPTFLPESGGGALLDNGGIIS
ncbi:MAG: SUMF1/EgtB/PvdO family nonheme iron enzyme, partial [Planctomycetes bacterium]|nr:SUMF1/EgtB/PvdO family nonheme iron enzyme [Planctomycetota bacterium]